MLPDKEVLFTLNGNPILVAKHHEIQKQFLKGIHAGKIGIKFISRNTVEKYNHSLNCLMSKINVDDTNVEIFYDDDDGTMLIY